MLCGISIPALEGSRASITQGLNGLNKAKHTKPKDSIVTTYMISIFYNLWLKINSCTMLYVGYFGTLRFKLSFFLPQDFFYVTFISKQPFQGVQMGIRQEHSSGEP